jgi:hypothetical protein
MRSCWSHSVIFVPITCTSLCCTIYRCASAVERLVLVTQAVAVAKRLPMLIDNSCVLWFVWCFVGHRAPLKLPIIRHRHPACRPHNVHRSLNIQPPQGVLLPWRSLGLLLCNGRQPPRRLVQVSPTKHMKSRVNLRLLLETNNRPPPSIDVPLSANIRRQTHRRSAGKCASLLGFGLRALRRPSRHARAWPATRCTADLPVHGCKNCVSPCAFWRRSL